METNLRLQMALKQQLVMTPKMQQALKLLQVPALQLEQLLRTEMIANPMLEEVVDDNTAEEQVDEEAERKHEEDLERWEDYFEAHFNDSLDNGYSKGSYEVREEYERVQVHVPTLHDHLLDQLRLLTRPEEDLQVGEYLIHSLDDAGFLDMSVDEISVKLRVDPLEVERVLVEAVQILAPPGVGARDLRECLLIQLRQAGEEGSLAWRIVESHMQDLERHRFQQIAKALRAPVAEVMAAFDEIGALEPRPGMVHSNDGARAVVPDLVVERVDDEYIINLNDRDIPRLQVSPAYRKLIGKGAGTSKETKAYVVEKLNSANWLIKTIEQRRQTMLKVMTHIVKVQREFLDKGIAHLRPLTLLEVADAIGMHESTVSRVTNGKYVQTPRGVFELKFFFSSALNTDGVGDVSSKAVKDRIATFIRGEDPARPFSDQAIVDLLTREGLQIARRTVAKYRDQLKILPARMRKRV